MTLQGCYVAIATPFTNDGLVNEAGLRSNIEFLIENGVAGIVPCGTTGNRPRFRGKSTTGWSISRWIR